MQHRLETDFTGYTPLREYAHYRVNVEKGTIINARGWLLGNLQNAGYYVLTIPGNPQHLLHRIIYIHHHGSIPHKYVIDHKDGDRLNNSISNLEAITHAENIRRAYSKIDFSKINFSPRRIVAVRLHDLQETTYESLRKLITDLGVAGTSVRYCIAGKTKSAYSKTKECRYTFKLPSSLPLPIQEPSSTQPSAPLPQPSVVC